MVCADFMMDVRMEQHMFLRFCANRGKSAMKFPAKTRQVFGKQSISCTHVFEWCAWFRTIEDDERT